MDKQKGRPTDEQKNGRFGIRVPKILIEEYNQMCNDLNSIPSIRIRKFVELELKYYKQKKDLLKLIIDEKYEQ